MPVTVWMEGDPKENPSWVYPTANEVNVSNQGLTIFRQQVGTITKIIAGIAPGWKAFRVDPEVVEEAPEDVGESPEAVETSETSEPEEGSADTPGEEVPSP